MSNARQKLPSRRDNETVEFDHWGMPFQATLGFQGDGKLGEVFLSAGKLASAADIAARDAAIAVSLALQHGCPPEVLRGAFLRDARGQAEGPLGRLMDLLATGDSP
jgi:hypothetical protein